MTYDKCELDVILQAAKDRYDWLINETHVGQIEQWSGWLTEARSIARIIGSGRGQRHKAERLASTNEYVLDQLKLYQSTR